MPDKPFLLTANLTKRFDGAMAVDGVNLSIHRGEIFALLGSSGCGKSTLLRMFAGFEKPSEGSIVLDGVDVANIPPYQRQMNMMFQSYALFPHLNVWDNIAFGLRRENLPKREVSAQVQAMLDLVQLNQFARRKPAQLSGGQQQRVALARSLAKRPRLLLLDEPLGALDKKLREQTQFELANIIEQVGVTCVMVTHDQQEAMTMANRIAVMSKGRVLQVGSPHQIYETPNCRFVADFIGNVNLFEGEHVGPGEVRGQLGSIFYADNADNAAGDGITPAKGSSLAIAVRPEKMDLSKHKPQISQNLCSGKVQEIAYFGSHNTYIIQPPRGRRVQVTMTNASREDRKITWDDKVWFWWSREDSVVLHD